MRPESAVDRLPFESRENLQFDFWSKLPARRDPGVTHVGLEHSSQPWERIMKPENEEPIGRGHIEYAAARRERGILVSIRSGSPWMVDVDDWVIGKVRSEKQLVAT